MICIVFVSGADRSGRLKPSQQKRDARPTKLTIVLIPAVSNASMFVIKVALDRAKKAGPAKRRSVTYQQFAKGGGNFVSTTRALC